MGNTATGIFIIFALIAGVVGFTTSLTGLHNIFQWSSSSLHTAATSSFTTWALTLLALGRVFEPYPHFIIASIFHELRMADSTLYGYCFLSVADLHVKRLNLAGLTPIWYASALILSNKKLLRFA